MEEDKTKEQLIDELAGLRREIDGLKASVPQHTVTEELIKADASTPSEEPAPYEGPKLSDVLSARSSVAWQTEGNWMAQMMSSVVDSFAEVNKELWLILSMLTLAAIMNYMVTSQHIILGFYSLPTLFSAYFYGRRHATLTAFASVFLIGLIAHYNPTLFTGGPAAQFVEGYWYDVVAWAGILVVTAYTMGTLHEHNQARVEELRQAYHGVLYILRQFISKDKYTENHSYRVSIYAAKIAAYLRFNRERIDDVRAASLLHDIGKLDVSRELLYKAARLTQEEYEGVKKHAEKNANMLGLIGGPLGRIIPIILAHHDRFDGSGYRSTSGEEIPLEARIISVADVYDSIASDRPYRKAMSPFDVKDIIVKGSGTEFDPKVVRAFVAAFSKREMEIPEVVL